MNGQSKVTDIGRRNKEEKITRKSAALPEKKIAKLKFFIFIADAHFGEGSRIIRNSRLSLRLSQRENEIFAI